MALTSPGVQVTVIDESFYTPAEPGTTPLIVIATAQDKSNAAGTGTAAGTTAANANKAFKITSQRELVDTFGVPFFEKTVSATPVHGGERNEYGLLAAYSYLGVSNAAFIVRASVDLDQLQGQTTAPGAEPEDGAWWVDTQTTSFGIQEWNGAAATTVGGQKFSLKTPLVLTDDDISKIESNAPKASIGAIGDYAVVFQTVEGDESFGAAEEYARIWYKSAGGTITSTTGAVIPGQWVLVGSEEWTASHPTVIGTNSVSSTSMTGSFKINGNTITGATLAAVVNSINALGSSQGISAKAVNTKLYIYSDGSSSISADSTLSGGLQLEDVSGDVFDTLGLSEDEFYPPALQQTPHTSVPTWKDTGATARPTGSVWIKTTEPNQGARWRVKRWNSATQLWIEYSSPIYASTHSALYYLDRSGGGVNIDTDSLFVQSNSDETALETAKFRVYYRNSNGATIITSSEIADATVTASTSVSAGSFVAGVTYIISNLGNTTQANWNTIAGTTSQVYRVGSVFTAAAAGTGGAGVGTAWTALSFTVSESLKGELELDTAKTIYFARPTGSGVASTVANNIAGAINAAGFDHVSASVTADNEVQISHTTGGDFRITDGTGTPIADIFAAYDIDTGNGTANFYALPAAAADEYLASNWKPLAADTGRFAASGDQPLAEPQDGQLWYNPAFDEVDIMVHNGNTWVGYKTTTSPYYAAASADKTDPLGPIVAASEPTTQTDSTPLKNGDLWISTADLENFPTIYRYDAANTEWVLIDKTDQTTEDGILFADARYGDSGATGNVEASIVDLLNSNYLDPDAPDPSLYPKGMLLWNLRRSGGNVKRYNNNYINLALDNDRYDPANSPNGGAFVSGESMSAYDTDRWTTASPNNEDGSGSFGRKAQRALIVQQLKSTVDTSSEIRDEERRNFNLIACPGYPETLSNLINLNIDRGLTAFVIGDTPLRLPSDATSLNAWGTNANGALDNGDVGIVSYDEYCAVYYPNGFTTDLGGANAVVPASHMMLRTIALSDQVSYPWFAPAGTRRGGITNATAVGYIDALTGEFQGVALNEGQRDTLYDLKVNPIPFFVGVGHVAYGQKTRARNASALDRINVARLVVYLRSQLNKLARPYIFEPNDKITRDEIKGAVESLLLELVGLRALYDFAVVCDESNNTDSRIDRNELYVDIAIEPTKAVEFIYIPLRIKNTGEI